MFTDGTAVLRWTGAWPTSVPAHDLRRGGGPPRPRPRRTCTLPHPAGRRRTRRTPTLPRLRLAVPPARPRLSPDLPDVSRRRRHHRQPRRIRRRRRPRPYRAAGAVSRSRLRLPEELRSVLTRHPGWTATPTPGGHLRVTHTSGAFTTFTSSSGMPSDWRGARNLEGAHPTHRTGAGTVNLPKDQPVHSWPHQDARTPHPLRAGRPARTHHAPTAATSRRHHAWPESKNHLPRLRRTCIPRCMDKHEHDPCIPRCMNMHDDLCRVLLCPNQGPTPGDA